MANPFIQKAIRLAFKDATIKTLDGLWDKMGRADLVGCDDFSTAPLFASIAYEVRRILKRRSYLEDQNNYRVVEGRSYFVEPKASRSKPLEEFIVEQFVIVNQRLTDRPTGSFMYWRLNHTKGWKRSRINSAEADHYRKKNGVPLYREWPRKGVRRVA